MWDHVQPTAHIGCPILREAKGGIEFRKAMASELALSEAAEASAVEGALKYVGILNSLRRHFA
jgi:hypothetical protein